MEVHYSSYINIIQPMAWRFDTAVLLISHFAHIIETHVLFFFYFVYSFLFLSYLYKHNRRSSWKNRWKIKFYSSLKILTGKWVLSQCGLKWFDAKRYKSVDLPFIEHLLFSILETFLCILYNVVPLSHVPYASSGQGIQVRAGSKCWMECHAWMAYMLPICYYLAVGFHFLSFT